MSEPLEQEHSDIEEMPMLAGGAAARLAKSVLARMASPFAQHSSAPIRPSALWRQVTRRLGVLPENEPQGRSASRQRTPLTSTQRQRQEPEQGQSDPFATFVQRSRSNLEFVWHTKHHEEAVEEEPRGMLGQPRFTPVRITPVTLPQTPTTAPPQPLQAAPSPTEVVPPLTPIPPTSAPVEPPRAPEPQRESAPTAPPLQRTPQPDNQPTARPELSPLLPVPETAPQSPPVLVPAKLVTLEYSPGPAVTIPQPLAAPEPLFIPPPSVLDEPRLLQQVPLVHPARSLEPQRGLDTRVARNLAAEVNKELVPDTDLLSRMVRTTNIELTPPSAPPRQEPQAAPAPVADAPFTLLPQASQESPRLAAQESPRQGAPVPVADAPFTIFSEAAQESPRLDMPLVPQQGSARPTRAAESGESKKEGPIGRFFERVVEALPHPVRRFFGDRDADQSDTQTTAPPPPLLPTPQSPQSLPEQSPATASTVPITEPASSPAPPVPTTGPGAPQQATSASDSPTPVQTMRQADYAAAPPPPPPPTPIASSIARQTPEPSRSTETQSIPEFSQPLSDSAKAESTAQKAESTAQVEADRASEAKGALPTGPVLPSFREVGPKSTEIAPERGAQSLFGSIVSSIFGRGGQEKEGSGPPAIEMPWARLKPKQEEGADRPVEQIAVPPVLPANGPTPITTPTPVQTMQAAQPSTGAATPAPQLQATTPGPAVPAPAASGQEAPLAQTTNQAPSLADPPAVELSIQESVSAVAAQEEARQTESPTPSESYRETRSSEPDTVTVQAMLADEPPSPLPMPHAHRATRNEAGDEETPQPIFEEPTQLHYSAPTQQEQPSAFTPSVEPPQLVLPSVPEPTIQPAIQATENQAHIPSPQTAEPSAPQEITPSAQAPAATELPAWETFSQVAQELAKAHVPLVPSVPLQTSAQSGLLSRLLGGLTRIGRTWEGTTDEPLSVPAPLTGVGAEMPLQRIAVHTQSLDIERASVRASVQRSQEAPSTAPTHTAQDTPSPYFSEAQVSQPLAPIGTSSAQPLTLATRQPLTAAARLPETVRDIRMGLPTQPVTPVPTATIPTQGESVGSPLFTADTTMPFTFPQRSAPVGDLPATYTASQGTSFSLGISPSPVVMRSVAEMAPSINSTESNFSEESDDFIDTDSPVDPWMNALQDLYGTASNDAQSMPLANPYSSFTLPAAEAGPEVTWVEQALEQMSAGQQSGLSRLSTPAPSVQAPGYTRGASQQIYTWSAPSAGSKSEPTGPGGDYSQAGYSGYGDEVDAETDAWAGIIADAASDVGADAPALALANNESSSSDADQQAEEGEKGPEGPDVDDLAESVYALLRRRLEVEREREFM